MPVDTSSYPTSNPINPYQTASEISNLRNSLIQNQLLQTDLPIRQQQLQQQQIQTQIAQGRQRAGQIISENTDENGNVNWLKGLSACARDGLCSHPDVFNQFQELANNQLQAVPGGYSGNTPINISRQNANSITGGGQATVGGNPQNNVAPPQSSIPSNSIQAGLAPGTNTAAEGSAEALNKMFTANTGSDNRVAALRQAKEYLGQTSGTGPKSEDVNKIKSLMLTFAPEAAKDLANINPNDVNAYDQLKKTLINYASNTPGADRSDLGLATSEAGNPNTNMQPAAIRNILNGLIGREIKGQVMAKEWANSAQPAANFNNWQSSWNSKNYDPRAFNMEDRTPEEAHDLMQEIKQSPSANNYVEALSLARKYGHSPAPKKKNEQ